MMAASAVIRADVTAPVPPRVVTTATVTDPGVLPRPVRRILEPRGRRTTGGENQEDPLPRGNDKIIYC